MDTKKCTYNAPIHCICEICGKKFSSKRAKKRHLTSCKKNKKYKHVKKILQLIQIYNKMQRDKIIMKAAVHNNDDLIKMLKAVVEDNKNLLTSYMEI